MPLTKLGNKMMERLKNQYGEKRGIGVFYAMEHTHPKWREL